RGSCRTSSAVRAALLAARGRPDARSLADPHGLVLAEILRPHDERQAAEPEVERDEQHEREDQPRGQEKREHEPTSLRREGTPPPGYLADGRRAQDTPLLCGPITRSGRRVCRSSAARRASAHRAVIREAFTSRRPA